MISEFLKEYSVGDSIDTLLGDDELSDAEIVSFIEEVLVPESIIRFAAKYQSMNEFYGDEDDLDDLFGTFCHFEGINEALANHVVNTINVSAASDDDAEDVDDGEVVFKPEDW